MRGQDPVLDDLSLVDNLSLVGVGDLSSKVKLWPHITHHKQRAFLLAYAHCGGVTKAAKASGVSTFTHYEWMAHNPIYREAFMEATDIAGDMLEEAAIRRAVDGIAKPVYYQGEIVGTVTEYSDGLLKFLLKGAKPFKYLDRVDLTTRGRSLNIVIDGGDTPLQLDSGDSPEDYAPPQDCVDGELADGELAGGNELDPGGLKDDSL